MSSAAGVWQYDNVTAEGAIALAFEAGFRQIDTAEMYVPLTVIPVTFLELPLRRDSSRMVR